MVLLTDSSNEIMILEKRFVLSEKFIATMGLLPDTQNCGLRMRRECWDSPTATSKETSSRQVRDARVVMHVGIANPRWQGKHSRCIHNPQFYVSGKRPVVQVFSTMPMQKCTYCSASFLHNIFDCQLNDNGRKVAETVSCM